MPDATGAPAPLPPGGPPPAAAPPSGAPVGQSIGALLQELLRDLPGLVSDRIELFSLELQRATRALAQIVMLLVAAAIIGVTAWLALWVGLAWGLMALGLAGGWTLLLVLAINAGAVYLALMRVRKLAKLLRLPATQRHLTPPHRSAEAAVAQADAAAATAAGTTP